MREPHRLEVPLQGKFREDAHRLSSGSGLCFKESADAQPEQASIVPGKEDAGSRALPAGERISAGEESGRRRSRKRSYQGPLQVEPALPRRYRRRLASYSPSHAPYGRVASTLSKM